MLPPELVSQIIGLLEKDIGTLSSCALVCRVFNAAATPLLYRQIHVSPPKVGFAWQVVEDTLGRKPFAASRLPSHIKFVQEFTLDGYLTKIRPSRQTPVPIIDKIPDALRMWHNLQVVTLAPHKATGPALLNVIRTLRHCPLLRAVTANEFAMQEDIVPDLVEITGLEDLTLLHPPRAVFMVLRDWLGNLRETLMSLNLLGNCGSLTPGVLRDITPFILNIQTLSIGLSYSLTNADIFVCLSQMPRLRRLRLRYYHQHGTLPPGPLLPALRHFIVLHSTLTSKKDADALSAWIRRISSSSPLESLETTAFGPSGPKLCFDGLISHVASKHSGTFREVRMATAYIRELALRTLLDKCILLQRCELTIAFSTLQAFPSMNNGSSTLRVASWNICDHPRLVVEKKDALKVMQRVPNLRCITVNGITWKGMWVAQHDEGGHVIPEFVVILSANIAQGGPQDDHGLSNAAFL